MALFVSLVEKSGSALLLVTHNREMANFAQRQCVLEAGHLLEGRPA